MEFQYLINTHYWFLYGVIAWVSSSFILTTIKRSKLNPKRLPPGPFPLPLFGNIFSLLGVGKSSKKLHESFSKLAQIYGPVISLQLGFQTLVVVSSASMAKEVLQTHDASFANRNNPEAMASHYEFSVAMRPADARWRMYRKICTTHIFSNTKLDATRALRKKKVQELLAHVQACCDLGEKVNIAQAVFTTSLNLLSNTIFSIDLGDPTSTIAREFRELTTNLTLEIGTPNFADFFPLLKAMDPQGIRKRTTAIIEKIINVFDTLTKERLESTTLTHNNDVLDALLSLIHESNEFQLTDMLHLLFDLFVGGTDTTSSTVEWAMAELLLNPEKMRKAQVELKEVTGTRKALEEEDIAHLPYLQAVVKETLRIHPPIPFLIPRKVFEENIVLDGFTIPKNAVVLVNVCAIGKDSSSWLNPHLFEPERFLGSSVDFKGRNFEFIPFGSGRRVCPGMPLGGRMLYLELGSLIHFFNWKLEDKFTPQTLNMEDEFGITLHKLESLCPIPLPKCMSD